MAMVATVPAFHSHVISSIVVQGRSALPVFSAAKTERKGRGRLRVVGEQCEEVAESRAKVRSGEILLCSIAPYPLLLASALPGVEYYYFTITIYKKKSDIYFVKPFVCSCGNILSSVLCFELVIISKHSYMITSKTASAVRSIFEPFVELVKTWNLPEWLVHWGHPGNMAVVLFAMGGYGTYLGFRIRLSKDTEEKAKAKDLHPKLLGGMFFFFALGATGGITALLTSNKPIFESPHAVSGFLGLALLTVQSLLPTLFEESPGMRTVHGLLGSSIMTLFLLHAALGLQLGLSF
ncbi:hypothetical protein ZIOFF_037276 [Zingiber officinale]|uniref:Uncharacterized protein n=1 Tax=Zingiber officinale TaxID=94328 RepID=A0A8J5GPX8_ZINOF|nr:hypothetical protein ZIOFF_037276 [Zingiber officinale]